MKRIAFAPKPSSAARGRTVDEWVDEPVIPEGQPSIPQPPTEPTKRLTIDVPVSLHKRMKTSCAADDLVMANVVRDLLSQRFPELVQPEPGAE